MRSSCAVISGPEQKLHKQGPAAQPAVGQLVGQMSTRHRPPCHVKHVTKRPTWSQYTENGSSNSNADTGLGGGHVQRPFKRHISVEHSINEVAQLGGRKELSWKVQPNVQIHDLAGSAPCRCHLSSLSLEASHVCIQRLELHR